MAYGVARSNLKSRCGSERSGRRYYIVHGRRSTRVAVKIVHASPGGRPLFDAISYGHTRSERCGVAISAQVDALGEARAATCIRFGRHYCYTARITNAQFRVHVLITRIYEFAVNNFCPLTVPRSRPSQHDTFGVTRRSEFWTFFRIQSPAIKRFYHSNHFRRNKLDEYVLVRCVFLFFFM